MPYFWTHIWLAPQFYVPVVLVITAYLFWNRGVRLKKYGADGMWRRIFTAASLVYGLIMAGFYLVEEYTSPAQGPNYMMHYRHWAIVGIWLAAVGVVLSIVGRGAARVIMTLLMLALLWWWWFVWSLSFLTF